VRTQAQLRCVVLQPPTSASSDALTYPQVDPKPLQLLVTRGRCETAEESQRHIARDTCGPATAVWRGLLVST